MRLRNPRLQIHLDALDTPRLQLGGRALLLRAGHGRALRALCAHPTASAARRSTAHQVISGEITFEQIQSNTNKT